MKYEIGTLTLSIALALGISGCAVDSGADTPPGEAVESSQSAIENGALVNDGSDPVAAAFPLSTVGLDSPSGHCTGVIVAPRLVLTAAHCTPDNTTTVSLYGTTGNTPVGNPIAVNAAVQWTTIGGNFADLSMVITATPMYTSSGPQRAVPLGPSASFATAWQAPSWEVGTGRINDVVGSNPSPRKMMWVPATIASPVDILGSFTTARSVGDHGDSGGPIYQKVGVGAGGLPNLILVGILSNGTAADARPSWDRFTSVESPTNYNWIQQEIAAAASASATPIRPPMFGTHFALPIERDRLPSDAGFGRWLPDPERNELLPEE